jgi:hypothetical protein
VSCGHWDMAHNPLFHFLRIHFHSVPFISNQLQSKGLA